MEQTYEEKRRQWEDGIFRQMVKNACGSVCYNCGSTGNVQYHHIVPLKLGGTNNLSNIAVLCSRCHKAAHRGQHISHYVNTENMGRPRSATQDVIEEALNDFFNGRIGTSECAKRVGIKAKKAHLTDRVWYKEYVKQHKIRSFQNKIDLLCSQKGRKNGIQQGEYVGYIEYEDGETKMLFYTKNSNN